MCPGLPGDIPGVRMTRAVIGIDCAVDPRRTGLALAVERKGRLRLADLAVGLGSEALHGRLARWMETHRVSVLALDAPLGWPASLGASLAVHQAGAPLDIVPNVLFRRATDAAVRDLLGKQPLDVGADRIARTAVAALALLQWLRDTSGAAIPVALDRDTEHAPVAIEVYPAGTLKACGLRDSGYKQPAQRARRVEILKGLAQHIDTGQFADLLCDDDNALDAAICTVAGQDFLTGRAVPPVERELARKEGWIWVRRPD